MFGIGKNHIEESVNEREEEENIDEKPPNAYDKLIGKMQINALHSRRISERL